MSNGIIRPENNIPPRESHKENENVKLPSEVSKKKIRTIGDFGKSSQKQQEDVNINTDPERKENQQIEEVVEKENKESVPIQETSDREIKESKIIPESLSDKKEEVDIPADRQHPKKEEETIPEQITGKKEEVDISANRQHPKKESDEFVDQQHESKNEVETYEERLHPEKEEPEFIDQQHEEKSEPKVEQPDHKEKIEQEPPIREDHPSKEELTYGEYDHESKIETEIDNSEHETKSESEIFNTLDHESKSETEIQAEDPGIEKSEIGFTKNGRDYSLDHHTPVYKAETDGYTYGQPDINTRDDTNYEDEIEQIDNQTQRNDKTENGPAPVQVDKVGADLETENVHFDDVDIENNSIKGDGYRFSTISSTNTENTDYSLEYSLRTQKNNVKDIEDYKLPEAEQEPTKTYRTIGSMSDTEKRQYQSLFTYEVEDADIRYPNDPKETNAVFNSASPTNTENVQYSQGNSQIDSNRISKLSDGVNDSGEFIDSSYSQQYENVNSILDNVDPQTQTTKNYSYEEIINSFLNNLSTDRPVQQPSQPNNSNEHSLNLNNSTVGREDAVNNSSQTNQVELRSNPKIADDLQDVSGIDNTVNKVAADSHETNKSYGQIAGGNFRAETLPNGNKTAASLTGTINRDGTDYQSQYKSPIYVDGGDIVVNHQSSPKTGDMTFDSEADTASSQSLKYSNDTSSVPFIDETSIIKPADQVDRIENDTITSGNILDSTLNENTVHRYSPKIGQRSGDTAENNSIEFRAQDIFAGPAAQLSMAVDFIQADARGQGERINIPYDITGSSEITNNTNSISFGTVKPKVDVRMPLLSILTSNKTAASLVDPIIGGLLDPLASGVAAQAGRYKDATINDTFANIATREILTDGMRFAYSRMHNAILYGPNNLGTSMSDSLDNEMDTSTPTGAVAKAVTDGVNYLFRIPPETTREDILRRGFIPTSMNQYINKAASNIYDNMTSYLNALRKHINGGLNISLNQPNNKEVEDISPTEQKSVARGLIWTEELKEVNRTLVSMLSPMEYENFSEEGPTKPPGYNIEEDRRDNVSSTQRLSWRKYNRNQKPETEEDITYGTDNWFAPAGENNLRTWSNSKINQAYTNRIQAYTEAGFDNPVEMAANDFRTESLFFVESNNITNNFDTDRKISNIEDQNRISRYTTVENSNSMYNVYRTAGLRRQVPNADQKNYNEISMVEGTDFDAHAIEIENAQILTGMKDDFYQEMKLEIGNYYSFGTILGDQDNSTNLINLKDHIANESDINLQKISSIVYPSISYNTYIESMKSTNQNTIQYIDEDGNPSEVPISDSHLAEVYNAVYSTEQGKDLFAEATQFPTFAQNVRGKEDQSLIVSLKQQTYFEDDDSDENKNFKNSINAVKSQTDDFTSKAIRENEGKTGYLKYLNETEADSTFTFVNQSSVENSNHILFNLKTQLNFGSLSDIIVLNEGNPTSRATGAERNSQLIGGVENAKLTADPENTFNVLSVVTDNTNNNSSETIVQGTSLANTQLIDQINTAIIDNRTVVDSSLGIVTDADPQGLKTERVKSNVSLSFRYSNHRFNRLTGEQTYSGENRVLNDGDEEATHKQNLINTINTNKQRFQDNYGSIGYLSVMTAYDTEVTDTTKNSFLYRIPFQFNPEISGESRTANWSNQQAFGRTNDILIWSNTSSRTLQFKTTLAILYDQDHDAGREGVVTDINPVYSWGQNWTKRRVLDTLNKYRMLVLPIDESIDGESNGAGRILSPPIIAIVRGQSDISWSKDFPDEAWYARWVVTDMNVDPRDEAGFTLDRVPRVYDITLSLKEVFNSVRSYQYLRGMKESLGIADI